jgi:hypothetical protein
MPRLIPLDNRVILAVGGPDRYTFLQHLITNDMTLLKTQPALYAALLTPQGRFLHDFIITEKDDTLRLEVERERLSDLYARLMMYKLRSAITIEDQSTAWQVMAFLGGIEELPQELHAYAYRDPRWPTLGLRLVVPYPITISASDPFSVYDGYRLQLGIPDGSRDMLPEKAIPLECGLDKLQAISWTKGCYPGQELTARTRHVGVVRKGIFSAYFEGHPPLFGSKIYHQAQEVGEILSHCHPFGLCRLRFEAVEVTDRFSYHQGTVKVHQPAWRLNTDYTADHTRVNG